MAVEAFGVFTGGVGLFSFLQSQLDRIDGGDDGPKGPNIMVKAGHPEADSDESDMEGDIGFAYAWDNNNAYMGKASGQHIGKGGEKTFVVDADVEGEQAGWAGVSADNDAVCVAWILVKQTDSSSDTAARWTGDVGRNCDQAWAYQNQVAGRYKDDGEEKEHKPACTWIDADHTGSTEIASIKFNVKSFGDDIKKIAEDSDKAICDHTAWGADNYPISAGPGSKKKRSLLKRSRAMANTLIVSDFEEHRAKELCESNTSHSSDFVGSDGIYCNQETKEWHYLCSTRNVDGCVNLEELEGQGHITRRSITKRSDGFKRAVDSGMKDYGKVQHWD